MLRPRIIPCLLIHKGGLYKTINFKEHKYVGDPLNAVRIFNEKEVDELIVIDIDKTKLNQEPDYEFIEKIATQCRMPLCYGGGIKKVSQVERIISLGVEKVAISSGAIENPSLICEASKKVGNQSIVFIMDIKKNRFRKQNYHLYTLNGTKNTGLDPLEVSKKMESLGAGEIVVNSIDRDGTLKGYDDFILDKIYRNVSIPLTALGGLGSDKDLAFMIKKYGLIGLSGGSFFVFKGKYRAVLIQYISPLQKENLFIESNK
tara:strand:- start:4807 stop:5586 length:780 start_codon:yes stop_codon:yes gene_type:complete